MAKAKYYKLGTKANSYSDPITKLKLVPGRAGTVSTTSTRLERAISKGQVVEINEHEYARMMEVAKATDKLVKTEQKEKAIEKAEEMGKAPLSDLSKAQLQERVKGLPGVTDEDITSTKKFNKDALIAFIENWEEPEEEEEETEEEEEEEDEDE